jgi:hypothetical protein
VDTQLDHFVEDQLNGGYGSILDQLGDGPPDDVLYDKPLCPDCDDEGCDLCVPYDDCPLDGDHDSTMTSIGWGTDEDYGSFGGDER